MHVVIEFGYIVPLYQNVDPKSYCPWQGPFTITKVLSDVIFRIIWWHIPVHVIFAVFIYFSYLFYLYLVNQSIPLVLLYNIRLKPSFSIEPFQSYTLLKIIVQKLLFDRVRLHTNQ